VKSNPKGVSGNPRNPPKTAPVRASAGCLENTDTITLAQKSVRLLIYLCIQGLPYFYHPLVHVPIILYRTSIIYLLVCYATKSLLVQPSNNTEVFLWFWDFGFYMHWQNNVYMHVTIRILCFKYVANIIWLMFSLIELLFLTQENRKIKDEINFRENTYKKFYATSNTIFTRLSPHMTLLSFCMYVYGSTTTLLPKNQGTGI